MGSNSRNKRTKKRKFAGNQFSNEAQDKNTKVEEDKPPKKLCISKAKLINDESVVKDCDSDGISFIIDFDCMRNLFAFVSCPECSMQTVTVEEQSVNRNGCALELVLHCLTCGYISKPCSTSKKQGQFHEVNRRLVYAMRQSGCGHREASNFMRVMNMPPPPNQSAYNNHNKVLLQVVRRMADEAMRTAAFRVHAVNDTPECGVSIDGSWQRRGYSSLNGVVTAASIDTGEIVDVEVLSKDCVGCRKWSKKDKTSIEYKIWEADHKCSINHHGSSTSMEPEGACRIFLRSKDARGLQYTDFYGDGDSKSYLSVCDIDPYPGKTISKKECIGHYQKRLGTALRNLKKKNKGIGGKGKLTNVKINRMQNYFGMALRNNTSSVEIMSRAIWGTFYHLCATDEYPLHSKCPEGKDSWCSYQQAVAHGKKEAYKHKGGLPFDLIRLIKPIYERLTIPEMLSKCLHGKTQNTNESFHGMIWNRCPKKKFASSDVVQLSTYDSVLHFNLGTKPELEVMRRMRITPGHFMVESVKKRDLLRISENIRQSTPEQKQRRKQLRGLKKTKEDKNVQKEGSTYGAGLFDNL